MTSLSRMALLALGVAALSPRPAVADPAAAALLKKAAEIIQTAKTYQAVYEMQIGAAGTPGMKMTVEVKALPGRKGWSRTSPINMTAYDDGKSLVLYSAMANRFQRGPSVHGKMAIQMVDLAKADKAANMRILRTETLSGRACTVVEITPGKPQSGPGAGRLLAYVDKSTSRLCLIKGSGTQKGPQGKAVAFNMTMTVTSEKLNAPIADSVFTFVPPKGAQEGMMTGPGPGPSAGAPRP
ncbi:MAG: hypothetical protein NT029_04610 [Armatimonadetes bacterium]|nr:hypothetical protein [Armatimonadota bacterium]